MSLSRGRAGGRGEGQDLAARRTFRRGWQREDCRRRPLRVQRHEGTAGVGEKTARGGSRVDQEAVRARMRRLVVLRPEPGASRTVESARALGLDAEAMPL